MVDWDKFAAEYDGVFLKNPLYRDVIERVVSLVEDGDGAEILDLGCGTGSVSFLLHERFPRAGITGVDPSEGMREVYAERFRNEENVSVEEGSSLSVPAADGSFDYVLSNLALHHVPPERREACAAELARVLKSGGSLIYADIFCDVDGPPDDLERSNDLIEKGIAHAQYCLDHGACEMAIILLRALPLNLGNDGEYLTTTDVWGEALRGAGLEVVDVSRLAPEEIAYSIIHARKPQSSGL
jgi:SAM-dependent methyltransferase